MPVVRRIAGALRATWPARRGPRSDRGATALEYGLLVVGIVIVVVAVVLILGGHLDAAFSESGH